MTEHGWPGEHHDHDPGHDDGAHEFSHHEDAARHDDGFEVPDDHWQHDEPPPPQVPEHLIDADHSGHPHDEPATPHPDPDPHQDLYPDPHAMGPVGADPDAVTEPGEAEPVFPAAVDVGPLPEPVDGFPWIDTASLGVVTPTTAGPPDDGLQAQEIAGYAATDLPPGADPWAALTDSDDPAAAALARFYAPHPDA